MEHITERVNFLLSLGITCLLVPLILLKSPKAMGNYKYLLLVFCLSDLHYATVHLILRPIIGTYKDSFYFFDDGYFGSRASISYFGASHSQALILLSYHFIYRYTVTERPAIMDRFPTSFFVFLFILIDAIEFTAWFCTCYYLYGAEPELKEYLQPILQEDYPGRENVEIVGIVYWNDAGEMRIRGLLAVISFNVIMNACAVVIGFTSFRIVRVLFSKTLQQSIKTVGMQRQLFLTLVLQLLFPIFLIYLPCFCVVVAPFLRIHIAFSPHFTSLIMTFFPFADALVILFGITEYRNYVLRMAGLRKPKKQVISPVSQFTTTAPSNRVTV